MGRGGWGARSLLVGMQTGPATVETSVKSSQKTENKSTPGPSYISPRHMPQGLTSHSTDTCSAMVIVALLTAAREGKQKPSTLTADKELWYFWSPIAGAHCHTRFTLTHLCSQPSHTSPETAFVCLFGDSTESLLVSWLVSGVGETHEVCQW